MHLEILKGESRAMMSLYIHSICLYYGQNVCKYHTLVCTDVGTYYLVCMVSWGKWTWNQFDNSFIPSLSSSSSKYWEESVDKQEIRSSFSLNLKFHPPFYYVLLYSVRSHSHKSNSFTDPQIQVQVQIQTQTVQYISPKKYENDASYVHK